MKCENFVLAAEIPCEWKFATKFASECECDGLVHSDTRHFRHFRRFTGLEQQSPCFLERKFVIFAVFVKNPLLFGGTKARFTKSTVSWTPIIGLVRPLILFHSRYK